MTQSRTPSFDLREEDGIEVELQNDGDIPSTGEVSNEEHDIELEVDDDTNLDVDVPDDETEDVSDEAPAPTAKVTPVAATTPRTKAPEGFVKPVEFAKLLSAHLEKAVPPQVVYSYIKNNSGESAKNPFPVHEQGGYPWYIKPEEGLAWWDAKNSRVATSRANRAQKVATAAEKALAAPAEAQAEVVEAE